MNFAEIANRKLSDVERPPIPPVGMYRFQITKIPSMESIANGAYDKVTFTCQAVEAYENVDEDDLKKFGGTKNVTVTRGFMFDNNDETKFAQTLFQLKSFIEKHMQVDGADKMSISEALNACVNAQFDGEVRWRADKNDKEVNYAEIGKTAPVRQ